jgi:inner membrane protein
MDPLSHAVVGGVTASLRSRNPKELRLAALCGVLAGMFPDLDVVIRDASNPMLGLGFHRHFTHSLVFVPFGSALVAWLLWLLMRKKPPLKEMFVFCMLGMVMHGLLDSMTNYGTHLFWPFTDRRESWSMISIIDPLFTLPLLGLLIAAAVRKNVNLCKIAAIFAVLYLSFGLYQREQATDAMLDLAKTRGDTIERFEVKPSFANLFAWRTQYLSKNKICIDAGHVSPWRGKVHYEGDALELYIPSENISDTQKKDLAFFTFFSDGWVATVPKHVGLIGDVRFSMLPNQLDPIWGIMLQPDKPDAHVMFKNTRSRKEGDIGILWKMIKGEPL